MVGLFVFREVSRDRPLSRNAPTIDFKNRFCVFGICLRPKLNGPARRLTAEQGPDQSNLARGAMAFKTVTRL
jgi:hypothetical protein